MRELEGVSCWIVRLGAIAFALFVIYTSGFGPWPSIQQRAIFVGIGFPLTLALYSPWKRTHWRKIPIFDLILMGLAVLASANAFVKYEWFLTHPVQTTSLDLLLGGILTLLTLETARRLTGWVFPTLVTIGILYTLFGFLVPGFLGHQGFSMLAVIRTMYQTTSGLWGYVTGVGAYILGIYLIFGAVLLRSGGGETFIKLAMKLGGRFRGGPALVAVIASSFFGTVSGSAVANVVTTGTFTIPLMKRLGYPPNFAGAVEATASTAGQMAPPIMGAGAFIMAELLGISYLTVVVAAIIPAFLFYLGLLVSVRFEAVTRNLSAIPPEEIPSAKDVFTMRQLSPIVVPIAVLLIFLVNGFSPPAAGFYAVVTALVVYVAMHPPKSLATAKHLWYMLVKVLEAGGRSLVNIASLLVCANLMVAVIAMTGLGTKFGELLIAVGGNNLTFALILGFLIAMILGMGLPTSAAYVLAAAVISTPLIKLGVSPLAANLFLFYYAVMSSVSPPVCLSVYTAAAIAKGQWFPTGVNAVRIAIVAYFLPFAFINNPALIMKGDPVGIITALISASAGAVFLGAGLMGALTSRLFIPCRILFIVAGGLFLTTQWQASTIAVGLVVAGLILQKFRVGVVN